MNYSLPPISAFDEICRLTEQTMRGMELDELILLHKQATREFHRAALSIRALTTVITEKTAAQGEHPQDRA